ncbi:hypothetical protein [Pseudomonas tohonis]|uniref:hypothetical protein n=1 Tax=Pseudomonas tohonis TaxID=2725477 RepID=UPI001F457135|nr:hypothetical protein [Pseudomonas tohonis]
MKIWSISDVQDTGCYRLLLCQNASGRRYFKLGSVHQNNHELPVEDQVLSTHPVSNHLLQGRDIFRIAESTLLSSGERFLVDAHGIWLTENEIEQMDKGMAYDRINWATIAPPFFPDR